MRMKKKRCFCSPCTLYYFPACCVSRRLQCPSPSPRSECALGSNPPPSAALWGVSQRRRRWQPLRTGLGTNGRWGHKIPEFKVMVMAEYTFYILPAPLPVVSMMAVPKAGLCRRNQSMQECCSAKEVMDISLHLLGAKRSSTRRCYTSICVTLF